MIRNKVRHLMVEDPSSHNEVIGIITTTDLARYLQKRMKHPAAHREDENEQQQQHQHQQQQSSSSSSEQLLLSEAWELYF
jgi:signal-transduction protein with cAMP-binding, CBS, and nucleotidyltransferase domain